jgi:hypothetical protein
MIFNKIFTNDDNGTKLSRKWPVRVLSERGQKWENLAMDDLIEMLVKIGLPAAEIERVKRYYGNDFDGLSAYVLYMKAMYDDRHEYLA